MAQRLVIHAGMHKTGSSSIQRALATLQASGFRYLDAGRGPNHSGAVHAAFAGDPMRYHTFVRREYTPDQVRGIGESVRAALAAQLRSSPDATCVLSAEGICRLDPAGLEALRAFATAHAHRVEVLAYVRPPRSFMESAFQQRVKGGMASFKLDALYPPYRRRLGPLERTFGRATVRLLPFRRDRLRDGDVVADFCAHAGLPRPPAAAELNRALSRRAVSLLYTYRRHGAPYGRGRDAIRANARLVQALETLGGDRLRFGGGAVDAALARHEGELRWVERRLGEALDEPGQVTGDAVGDEADLLRYDDAQLEWLAGWGVPVPARAAATPEAVAAAMHAAMPVIAEASRLGR